MRRHCQNRSMESISSPNVLQKLHFVLIPLPAQGRMIPMIDIARLLGERGVTVSFITTPVNFSRIKPTIDRISDSKLPIHFIPLRFPSVEFDLPQGCENLDSIPSRSMIVNFYNANKLLKDPLLDHLRDPTNPPPRCIITDSGHAWTVDIARAFNVPRIIFQGYSCFSLLCTHNLTLFQPHESVSSDSDPFLLPGLPHRIEITRPQLPRQFNVPPLYQEIHKEIRDAELISDGVVVNSFDELEQGYSGLLEKSTGKKAWMIGPVSLCNKGSKDLAERGNKASVDAARVSSWLDSKSPKSVVYVCFGSMGTFAPSQLTELGSGLLASNRPFIWVIKSVENSTEEFENWLSEKFVDESRCLLIRGWAPQVMILSHPAVGGFVTHCGWNSTLEGVSAGVPMVTWPLFAEQFLNEKLVVEVLGIAVSAGVKTPSEWAGEVKDEVVLGREEVAKAVERVMEEGGERRSRAEELGKKAKRALEEGGSSYLNLTMLIQYALNYNGGK